MKASINPSGVMIITPENETEEFALNCFKEMAFIAAKDEARMQDGYWLGNKIQITEISHSFFAISSAETLK